MSGSRAKRRGVTDPVPHEMSGQEQPDSGTITLGETVKLASVDQRSATRDGQQQNRLGRSVRRADIMKTAIPKCRGRAYVAASTSKASISKRAGELVRRYAAASHRRNCCRCGRQRPAARRTDERLRYYRKPQRAENALLEFPLRDGYPARPLVP